MTRTIEPVLFFFCSSGTQKGFSHRFLKQVVNLSCFCFSSISKWQQWGLNHGSIQSIALHVILLDHSGSPNLDASFINSFFSKQVNTYQYFFHSYKLSNNKAFQLSLEPKKEIIYHEKFGTNKNIPRLVQL